MYIRHHLFVSLVCLLATLASSSVNAHVGMKDVEAQGRHLIDSINPSDENEKHCHKSTGLACTNTVYTIPLSYQNIILSVVNVAFVSNTSNKQLFLSPSPLYRPPIRICY
mgnify:FL=1